MNRTKSRRIFLFIVLITGIFLRFWQLGTVPPALQQDESSIGYNAYSILITKHDEHGQYLPQNFKAFGEYKLPGYIYASVLPIYIFGLTQFSIRFISALSGSVMLIFIYLLSEQILGFIDEKQTKRMYSSGVWTYLPTLALIHLALNPWHLHFSRAAFEVTLASAFVLIGTSLFLAAVKRNNLLLTAGSMVFMSASVYTYNIARLFTPLFVLYLLLAVLRRDLSGNGRRIFFISLSAFIITLLPFFIGWINQGGFSSTKGTLIFSSAAVQSNLTEFRSYFLIWNPVLYRVLFNKYVLTFWFYINNVIQYISPAFFFVNGGSNGITSIGTSGDWYIFELPLFIGGLITLIKSKGIAKRIIIGWIVLVIMIASLTREAPQATRSFLLIIPVTIVISFGSVTFIRFLQNIRRRTLQLAAGLVTIFIILFYVTYYFASYYVRFPVYYAKNWRTADKELSLFLSNHSENYTKVIFDYDSGFMYSSLLAYTRYDPGKFQLEAVWSPDDSEGFSHPVSFGKYEFRDIDWKRDLKYTNALLVTSPGKVPLGISVLSTFSYPQRPVVISQGQKIINYPVTEPAYVLVSTGMQ